MSNHIKANLVWPLIVAAISGIPVWFLFIYLAEATLTINPHAPEKCQTASLAGKDAVICLQQTHKTGSSYDNEHTVSILGEAVTLSSKDKCFETPAKSPVFRTELLNFDQTNGVSRYYVERVIKSDPECRRPISTINKKCYSGGQVCDQIGKFVTTSRPGSNYQLKLTGAERMCSKVKYSVSLDGTEIGNTKPIGAKELGFVNVGILKSRVSEFQLQATGTKGGCNTGVLDSWAVKAELTLNK